MRCQLDNIMRSLSRERRGGGVTPEEDDSQKRSLRLQFETMLRFDIKVWRRVYEVEGYPDYSVWYEDIRGNADKPGPY